MKAREVQVRGEPVTLAQALKIANIASTGGQTRMETNGAGKRKICGGIPSIHGLANCFLACVRACHECWARSMASFFV
jgi:hypothetical protein